MKKILLLAVFTLVACKGKLVWVSNDSNKIKDAPVEIKLDTNIAGVEFTFDDGPDLAKTPKVLDILKKYNLQATFFIEGINLAGDSEQAKERRELLRRMDREGHRIGNHTYDHKDLCKLSIDKANWELDVTDKLMWQAVSSENNHKVGKWFPSLEMRPPYGKKCKQLTKILQQRNLSAIYWDIDPREWERDPKTHQFKTAAQVVDGIMAQYHQLHDERGLKKMVIILHDTKQVTVELLPSLLDQLSKEAKKQ